MSTINGRACVANGRNLLTGTNNTLTTVTDSTDWGTGLPRLQPAETLKANQTYTASCYLEPSAHDVAILAKTANGIVTGTVIAAGSKGISTLTITLTQEDVKIANIFWISFLSQQTDKSAVSFKCFKLEKGSYATPWSPTPVDKVFSNGKQVYGRNLLRSSEFDKYWTIPSAVTTVDGYEGHKAIHVDTTGWTSGFADVQQPIYNADVQLIKPGEWYTISFYAKGTVFIRTHIYPSVVDISAGSYTDGVFYNGYAPTDGLHDWTLTDEYVRHSWSFKAKTPLSPTTNEGKMLFRTTAGNSTYISLPKLEQGISATPWTPAPEDVM